MVAQWEKMAAYLSRKKKFGSRVCSGQGRDQEGLLNHGLAKPHFPVGSKTEHGGSAVVATFGAVRVTDHGGKHPVDGNGPGAQRHGHSDEGRGSMDE